MCCWFVILYLNTFLVVGLGLSRCHHAVNGTVILLPVLSSNPSWRHHHRMETFSVKLALWVWNSPVTSEFPSQRPCNEAGFGAFFDQHLSKRLCKLSGRGWFETPSRSSWSHCNAFVLLPEHLTSYFKKPRRHKICLCCLYTRKLSFLS